MSNIEPSKGWPEPTSDDAQDIADARAALAEPDGRITMEALEEELGLSQNDK